MASLRETVLAAGVEPMASGHRGESEAFTKDEREKKGGGVGGGGGRWKKPIGRERRHSGRGSQ